jgi:hypothetical protein
MSDPIVRQRFTMQARLQGGSFYQYALIDEAENVIGSYTRTRTTKKGVSSVKLRYALGTGPDATEYETPLAFMEAYKQQLKEKAAAAEWDAAAPKPVARGE